MRRPEFADNLRQIVTDLIDSFADIKHTEFLRLMTCE